MPKWFGEIIDRRQAATEIYEGERRFQAIVRLPESVRDSVDGIRRITLTAPNGALVRLDSLARIEVLDGPAQMTSRRRCPRVRPRASGPCC